MKIPSHNSSLNSKPETVSSYKIPSLAVLSATMVLTACGGGGGGGDDQPALDQDCVNLFSNEPFNWSTAQIQSACSDVEYEDVDDFDDGVDGNTFFSGSDTTNPTQPDDATPNNLPDSITPSATPALYTAPADVAGGLYYQNSNNSAIISGPLFGAGTSPNDSLVKPVAFNVDSADSDLQLIELRAFDNGVSNASLFGIVQNTGTTMHCFAEAAGIGEYTASGTALPGALLDFSFFTGVVGTNSTGTMQTDTCINPGNFAYIDHTSGSTFIEIAEVAIDSLEYSNSDYSQVTASVLPISYSVGISGVDVTIVNQHSVPVELVLIQAIALDGNGQAIAVDTEFEVEMLDPGEEYIVRGVFPDFQGQTGTMRVLVDFNL